MLAQLVHEPGLRVIAPRARHRPLADDVERVDAESHPGLSFRLLPWGGDLRTFRFWKPWLRRTLRSEAHRAAVWHACCSIEDSDLTTESFLVGRGINALRILGLDSDPSAMLAGGGDLGRAERVGSRYERWASEADLTIVVGEGVRRRYAPFAKRTVVTNAVWLRAGDLMDEDAVAAKHRLIEPIRFLLPSRLTSWKGVNDAIRAFRSLPTSTGDWTLTVVGEGPEEAALKAMAAGDDRISFAPPIPYGPLFFDALSGAHAVIVPTRGEEEVRIVYDAMARGCVLVHSATETLSSALADLTLRWTFRPGDAVDLATAVATAIDARADWGRAALGGRTKMVGRTIDDMHATRAEALALLRS